MNWLQTYMPQKHKAIAENLRTLERKSPEPITWEEGVADIMAVRPNRFPHGKFTRTELPPNPGAKVLIVGETPNGDDVRFVFYQGTTGEGSHKAAIVNGKEIIGSGFADVLQEL
jgi:hypothetical protein